jgi:prolipoprotein diacylglyceryltransferase
MKDENSSWILRRHKATLTLTARPAFVVLGMRFHSFRACGALGVFLATACVAVLVASAGLSYAIAGSLLVSGVVTFLALAMATKMLTGNETLIYYHHEIAILLVSAALLSAFEQPVLPYLDLNALWLGIFLSCGRGGCLMVGCCHGRPHHWGVRYGEEHASEGFPACYVGVRLFPVQVLESLIVISIVVANVWLFLQGRPAGMVLATYVVTYSAARIWLEEFRGDGARPYWGRFSEAQWTSAVLIAVVLMGEWQGRLPWSGWHLGVGLLAVVSMLVLLSAARTRHAVLHPQHASEVALLVQSLKSASGPVSVRRTSMSFGISTQSLGKLRGEPTVLYSLSHGRREMLPSEARALSGLIVNLVRPGSPRELRQGRHGVFHLIVRDAPL